jgi:hypothetical protein
LLLGQPRVAGQVKEAHRRNPLRPAEDASLLQRGLDVLDQVLGLGQLLLPAVHGRHLQPGPTWPKGLTQTDPPSLSWIT